MKAPGAHRERVRPGSFPYLSPARIDHPLPLCENSATFLFGSITPHFNRAGRASALWRFFESEEKR